MMSTDLGADFMACMQAVAAKTGLTARTSPRPVHRTAEEEETYHRQSIVADVLAGRLRAEVWL